MGYFRSFDLISRVITFCLQQELNEFAVNNMAIKWHARLSLGDLRGGPLRNKHNIPWASS